MLQDTQKICFHKFTFSDNCTYRYYDTQKLRRGIKSLHQNLPMSTVPKKARQGYQCRTKPGYQRLTKVKAVQSLAASQAVKVAFHCVCKAAKRCVRRRILCKFKMCVIKGKISMIFVIRAKISKVFVCYQVKNEASVSLPEEKQQLDPPRPQLHQPVDQRKLRSRSLKHHFSASQGHSDKQRSVRVIVLL